MAGGSKKTDAKLAPHDVGVRLLRLANRIHSFGRTKKYEFGRQKQTLYQAEVSMVDIIGEQPGLNVTELARLTGVTRGAVSQMMSRLVERGLVDKKPKPQSGREVIFKLTRQGKAVHRAYQRTHACKAGEMEHLFECATQKELRFLDAFLSRVEGFLDAEAMGD